MALNKHTAGAYISKYLGTDFDKVIALSADMDIIKDVHTNLANINTAIVSSAEAEKWANENEDVVVSNGKFSAKHWATKAAVGSVLTTKGDLSVFTTTAARLDIGQNDYVLTADSTAPSGVAWKVAAGGGGAVSSVAGRTGVVVLTKTDVGLANVDNTSDVTKQVATLAAATAIDVGLGNVNNTSDATKQAATLTAATKSDVGLGSVDNTTDAAKPISAATVTALALKLDATLKGANNGLAELDAGGRVPSSQIAGIVLSSSEYANLAAFPGTGDLSVFYVALDTAKGYRWTGTIYLQTDATIAIGETITSAYRGDRGKIAYDHSVLITGNPHSVTKGDLSLGNVDNTSDSTKQATILAAATKTDVGLGNVDNTSDVSKPISSATQTALDLKVDDTQVLTNVPVGALFTDTNTTYSVGNGGLTEINFTTADNTKLDSVETGATADQTAVQIKALYEAEPNAYTDTKDTKLTGISTGADVSPTPLTDAQIKTQYELNSNTNAFDDAAVTKLAGVATSANLYVHPTADGDKHIPVNGTGNLGKVLTASATAGVSTWEAPTGGIQDGAGGAGAITSIEVVTAAGSTPGVLYIVIPA